MFLADNYIDRIDFLKYLPQTDCAECGAKACEEFVESLKRGERKTRDCPDVPKNLYYPFETSLNADEILPKFNCLTVPQPGPTGLVEINKPTGGSPILISGNNVHTQDVLMSVLGTTKTPFFILFTNTQGHTVDMAVIYGTLTAGQIMKDARDSGILNNAHDQQIVLPGLSAGVADELGRLTGRSIMVGPVCAAELPLFFSAIWLPPHA